MQRATLTTLCLDVCAQFAQHALQPPGLRTVSTRLTRRERERERSRKNKRKRELDKQQRTSNALPARAALSRACCRRIASTSR
jgi:hypothetical protein